MTTMPPKKKRKTFTGDVDKGARSRILAKMRRDKENEEMANLLQELPLSEEVRSHLDKLSVVRIALSFLQLQKALQECNLASSMLFYDFNASNRGLPAPVPNPSDGDIDWVSSFSESLECLNILKGFILCISNQDLILYVSENVTQYLGHQQEDIIGQPIKDFVHSVDHKCFAKQMAPRCLMRKSTSTDDVNKLDQQFNEAEPYGYFRRNFHLHMGCCFEDKDGKVKKRGFLPIHFTGKLLLDKLGQSQLLTCLCRPLESTPLLEIRTEGSLFQSRLSLDLKYIFVEPRVINLIGYEPNELVGKGAYDFHCPGDAKKIKECHKDLIGQGHGISELYRFLGKNTDWIWMKSKGSVVYNTANNPQYISCVTFIVSEEEARKTLLKESSKLKELPSTPTEGTSSGYSTATGSSQSSPQSSDSMERDTIEGIDNHIPRISSQRIMIDIDDNLASDLQIMTLEEIMSHQAFKDVDGHLPPDLANLDLPMSSYDLQSSQNDQLQRERIFPLGGATRPPSQVSIPSHLENVDNVVTCTKVNSSLKHRFKDLSLDGGQDKPELNVVPKTVVRHHNLKHSATKLTKRKVKDSMMAKPALNKVDKAEKHSELRKMLLEGKSQESVNIGDKTEGKIKPAESNRPLLTQLLTGKISQQEAIELSRPKTPPPKQATDLFRELSMPLSPNSQSIIDNMVEEVNLIEQNDNTIFSYWSGSSSGSLSDKASSMSLVPSMDAIRDVNTPTCDENFQTADDYYVQFTAPSRECKSVNGPSCSATSPNTESEHSILSQTSQPEEMRPPTQGENFEQTQGDANQCSPFGTQRLQGVPSVSNPSPVTDVSQQDEMLLLTDVAISQSQSPSHNFSPGMASDSLMPSQLQNYDNYASNINVNNAESYDPDWCNELMEELFGVSNPNELPQL